MMVVGSTESIIAVVVTSVPAAVLPVTAPRPVPPPRSPPPAQRHCRHPIGAATAALITARRTAAFGVRLGVRGRTANQNPAAINGAARRVRCFLIIVLPRSLGFPTYLVDRHGSAPG